MGAELGRVSGPLLSANLLRDGIDLAFETDLLYLNVIDGRVGVKTDTPNRALQINGTSNFTDLLIPNTAQIGNLFFTGNTIQNSTSSITISPNQLLDPKIVAPKYATSQLELSDQLIANTVNNSDIVLTPSGSGQVIFNTSEVYITGGLHATGDITWEGNVTVGDSDADSVTFSSDVSSNIIPDQTNTYDLGSVGKVWKTLYSDQIQADTVTSATLIVNDIDMLLTQGNTIYVSVNGLDTNTGEHLHSPFRTVKHALSVAQPGDEIVVFPGEYTEIFPLTVPQGVSVKGSSIRSVTVKPTVETKDKDAFLLNGETTVSHLTVKDFIYNSALDTGYGFRFAPNASITSRSPYVQNITVITQETLGSGVPADIYSDPLGLAGSYSSNSVAVDQVNYTQSQVESWIGKLLMTWGGETVPVTFYEIVDVIDEPLDPGFFWRIVLDRDLEDPGEGFYQFSIYPNTGETSIVGTAGYTAATDYSRSFLKSGLPPFFNTTVTEFWTCQIGESLNIVDSIEQDPINSNWWRVNFKDISLPTAGLPIFTSPGTLSEIAGRGALVDGADVSIDSRDASMLFSSVTFIVPNSEGITVTNGSRVEWINCFTYYANRGIHLTRGTTGFTKYGGEAQAGGVLVGPAPVLFSFTPTSVTVSKEFYSESFVNSIVGKQAVFDNYPLSPAFYTVIGVETEPSSPTLWRITFDSTFNPALQLKNVSFYPFNSNYVIMFDIWDTTGNSIGEKWVAWYKYNLPSPDFETTVGPNWTINVNGQLYTVDYLIDDPINPDMLRIYVLESLVAGVGIPIFTPPVVGTITTYGAEMRSINSANIYGTYGAVADGTDTLAYLIGHNFGYVGTGTNNLNDNSIAIQANEVVELNSGVIYYDSMDHKGDYRIGDIFYVNQEQGTVTFDAQSIDFGSTGNITFEGPTSTTIINKDYVQTGNIRIYDNNVDSLQGPINLAAASGSTYLNTDVFVTGNLTISNNVVTRGVVYVGNDPLDLVTITPNLTQNINPKTTNLYSLGSDLKRWDVAYIKKFNIDGSIDISNNSITALGTNSDLNLVAAGTGIVEITQSDVDFNQSLTVGNTLTVSNDTGLKNTEILGELDLTGDYLQTGNVDITGLVTISNNITILGSGNYLESSKVRIQNNSITATETNSDIVFNANGVGQVRIENFLSIGNGTITNTRISPASDLERSIRFSPNGTGSVVIDSARSLQLPVGNQSTMTFSSIGEVRYNNQSLLYEGWTPNGLVSFNDIWDSDRNTYITAELTPGANDNTLRFGINGSVQATIDSTKLSTNVIHADGIEISGNIIRTLNTASDLNLNPNGTGILNVNNIRLKNNSLTNINSGALTLATTGLGYVRFNGTGAVVFPYGTTGQRRLTPEVGEIRNNSTLGYMEVYSGDTNLGDNGWIPAAGISTNVTEEQLGVINDLWTLILG